MNTRIYVSSIAVFSSLALSASVFAACGGNGTDAAVNGDTTGAGGSGTAQGGSSGKGGASGKAGASGKGGSAGAGGGLVGGSGGASGAAGASAGASGAAGSSAGGSAGHSGGGTTGGSGGTTPASCSMTQKDCDGNKANGCESDTTSDLNNCGMCGHACAGAMNADGVCVHSQCVVTCQPGFAACTGSPSDGCTTDTTSDPTNCGECGHACDAETNGAPACSSGKCSLACVADYQNCNNDLSDGCEAHTPDDPLNCGNCGMTCSGPCMNGACTCAGTSASAQPVPLDIYIMLDRSGSMNEMQMGMTRWQVVTNALTTFFNDPSTAGTKIGLQYFPLSDPMGTSCDPNYYYSPAVPMGLLPGAGNAQSMALTSSMTMTMPLGGTPTNISLAAALSYAADWKKVEANDTVVVVLATDGQPGDGCGADITNASMAAMTGFSGTPSIPTYVIGVGPEQGNLDQIAMAGGTTSAFVVNDGDASAFIAALQSIKKSALGCSYAIPKPSNGGSIDFTKVNVDYTPGGGAPMELDGVASMADCGANGGWYYDNPASPTQIILCDATCTAVQADSSASIDIVLGCETKKE